MVSRVAQESFKGFVEDLRATHGDNLAAVVLYGAAAAGDEAAGQSDYNLLVSLRRITPEDLRLAQAPTREWQRLGYSLPVYFTAEELRDGADVFPIEYHQMQRARVVLYGEDPFATLEIGDHNLRHQTEYELRSKLIQLRRLYIPSSVSVERLSALMGESISTFAALFAAALMLHGVEPPARPRECVQAAAKHFKLDGAPFERIFALRRADEALAEREAHALFAAYLAQIEQVVEAVDELDVNSPS